MTGVGPEFGGRVPAGGVRHRAGRSGFRDPRPALGNEREAPLAAQETTMKRKTQRGSKSRTKAAGFYSALPAEQLDAIAAPYDKEFVPTRPLTAKMRAEDRRAKRKRGRPLVGEGAEKVLVTLERSLLREADSYARRHKKNRSQLITEGIRAILQREPMRRAS
jgi:hypothetical protein